MIEVTSHVIHREQGAPISIAAYPADDGKLVVAALKHVYNPHLSNLTDVDVYVRGPGTNFDDDKVAVVHTTGKGDSVALDRNGNDLIVLIFSHELLPPDPNNARPEDIEKADVPGIFLL